MQRPVGAVARPFALTTQSTGPFTIILLDASASMQATDVKPSRFEAARAAIRQMIEALEPGQQLALVELIWSAIWWVVDREDGLGVVTALLRKILAIGFFYALLLNGGAWIPAIIQGFSQAGARASGVADLSPSGVFDQGLALANKILNAVEGLGILEGVFPSLVAALTALVVVVSFAIIAAQLLVALVEGFIVVGAGILFVGFSGARWTKFFTERYLSYVASVGVKLFVLYLIMGVGMGIAARWVAVLGRGGFSPIPFFYVMGGSLVFLFLTWHIPSVAAAMMAGAVHLSCTIRRCSPGEPVRPASRRRGHWSAWVDGAMTG